ncbi:MAG: carbohydrate ABC transporter substrate-binding protein [Lachnospiraceae bacterium]|nr:carbohydrate ABC transporter substrate-binding protein [Lachnospiraceae bacterium]
MKKFMACALSTCMVAATLVGCEKTPAVNTGDGGNNGDGDNKPAVSEPKDKTIELWAFTDEVPKMVEKYQAANPDFDWKVNVTIKGTGDGYQDALDQALMNNQVDMFAAEAAFVLKYAQGDMAKFAGAYEDLGIDVAGKTAAAEIAPYTIEIGTRPSDGKLVGLGYQATGGAFIYRRSVAKATWGDDDPAFVKEKIGGGSGSWDKYWDAAEELKAKGYGICSGDGDMWHAIENSSDKGWIVDDKLYIDPKREAFFDVSKKLKDNGYHNDTQDWTDAWYADMKGTSEKDVLGFFGPAWLINYVIKPQAESEDAVTATDWAVTESPIGFFWGGTWVMASQAAIDNGKGEAIAKLIEYITLDDSEAGLQYAWANGTFDGSGVGDCVASGTVMAKSKSAPDLLAGQNMFDYFIPANASANGKNLTQYDEKINNIFRDQVRQYTAGNKSKEEAIEEFKTQVNEQLGIAID